MYSYDGSVLTHTRTHHHTRTRPHSACARFSPAPSGRTSPTCTRRQAWPTGLCMDCVCWCIHVCDCVCCVADMCVGWVLSYTCVYVCACVRVLCVAGIHVSINSSGALEKGRLCFPPSNTHTTHHYHTIREMIFFDDWVRAHGLNHPLPHPAHLP